MGVAAAASHRRGSEGFGGEDGDEDRLAQKATAPKPGSMVTARPNWTAPQERSMKISTIDQRPIHATT
jgi:hypothetical protein